MGVTLMEELPFAHAVHKKHAEKVCANCMKPTWESGVEGSLSRCSRCKFVRYCDNKCQKSDWLNHKPECKYLLCVSPRIPETVPRLMGRIITKLQRDGDTKPAFNGRLFSSLLTNASEIEKDDEKRAGFVAYSYVIKDYLPEMPPKSDIFKIFCKVIINSLEVTDSCLNGIGLAVYLGFSALDHSCKPDAYILFNGTKAILRSLNNDIKEYSDNLHIQYCDTMEPGPARRGGLSSQYCFVCDCELCQDTEIDRQKYSLRCTKCNDGFCPYSPGGENPEIRCKVCGEISDYNLDDVQRLHERLTDPRSSDKQLDKLIDFYRECCIVFSICNVPLCKLANDIIELAVQDKKYNEAVEYAEKSLLCHRTYFPKGHPLLSVRVYEYGKILMMQGNMQCKSVFGEAFQMVRESHGDGSKLTLEIARLLSQ